MKGCEDEFMQCDGCIALLQNGLFAVARKLPAEENHRWEKDKPRAGLEMDLKMTMVGQTGEKKGIALCGVNNAF